MTGSCQTRAQPLLMCLDALEPVTAGDAAAVPPPWQAQAAGLLVHARRGGWPVLHVMAARPGAAAAWRAIPGLGPEPLEPVFYRTEVSALSNATCARLVAHHHRADVMLIGCSLESCGLATSLALVEAGRAVVAVVDALAAPAAEREGFAGLAKIARLDRQGEVRLQTARGVMRGAPALRLLAGGRA